MVDPRAPAIAVRAAELALDRGIDLADDLALWSLAGGRPVAAARAGDPRELGDLLEQGHDAAHRRRQGAHYTPPSVAGPLVERALRGHQRPLVGDPACGGGALLIAALEQLEERGDDPADVVGRLFGADIDPLAVATTEVALWLCAGVRPPAGHVVAADTLLDDLAWPPLDVLVGNPPFLSQLATTTTRRPGDNTVARSRLGDAVQPYTDTSALFLLRSLALAAPDATVVMLQPLSVLGARDARGAREAVGALGTVDEVWLPPPGAFDAAVDVCAPVVRLGSPSDLTSWSAHLARAVGVPAAPLHGRGRLGDEAQTAAGFRAEFYGLAAHLHEQEDLPGGRPLVTAGLIDLGGCSWGGRPARVAGRTWTRPVVDVHALDGRASAWVERTAHPKLIVATQTRVIELVVDDRGELVPGVPLVAVLAPADRLWALAAALASPAVTAWALHRVAGTAMSATALKVTAALLREVPLPVDDEAWDEGSAAFARGDIEAYAAAMAVAYGVGPEVGAWWLERARTVWSPTAVPR